MVKARCEGTLPPSIFIQIHSRIPFSKLNDRSVYFFRMKLINHSQRHKVHAGLEMARQRVCANHEFLIILHSARRARGDSVNRTILAFYDSFVRNLT